MKTIVQYCKELGWNQARLSRETGLSANTIRKAMRGEAVATETINTIATAFSRGFGERILVKDISGVNPTR